VFTRRTVITYEKLEQVAYRFAAVEVAGAWCEECGTDVRWLTPYQVLAMSGLTLREIFRRIESHQTHFRETAAGLLVICYQSVQIPEREQR